ncbi:hypothetical protein, partial [Burkholderia gladioli]|uniref:hypothetical protein n=1 Tax=Burkholderia gladioli TaxID=28095 RepID=UPI0016410E4D
MGAVDANERMISMKNTFLMLISTALILFSAKVFADGDMTLSAKQIRPGCSVVVHKEYPSGVDPNINSAAFDQQLRWKCDGAPTVKIGTIEAQGSGPEIVTVFYRPNEILVLARWRSDAGPVRNFVFEAYFCPKENICLANRKPCRPSCRRFPPSCWSSSAMA